MAKQKKTVQNQVTDSELKKIKVIVTQSLRGRYKLPFSKGHVIEVNEVVAKELIENNDATEFSEKNIEVVSPTIVSK